MRTAGISWPSSAEGHSATRIVGRIDRHVLRRSLPSPARYAMAISPVLRQQLPGRTWVPFDSRSFMVDEHDTTILPSLNANVTIKGNPGAYICSARSPSWVAGQHGPPAGFWRWMPAEETRLVSARIAAASSSRHLTRPAAWNSAARFPQDVPGGRRIARGVDIELCRTIRVRALTIRASAGTSRFDGDQSVVRPLPVPPLRLSPARLREGQGRDPSMISSFPPPRSLRVRPTVSHVDGNMTPAAGIDGAVLRHQRLKISRRDVGRRDGRPGRGAAMLSPARRLVCAIRARRGYDHQRPAAP